MSFFQNWESSMLLDSFDYERRVSKTRQSGNEKVLESATFEIRKSIMAPKWLSYGMSTSLPRHGPKWKSEKYRLELRNNNEVGVIKWRGGTNVKKTNTDLGISVWNM